MGGGEGGLELAHAPPLHCAAAGTHPAGQSTCWAMMLVKLVLTPVAGAL